MSHPFGTIKAWRTTVDLGDLERTVAVESAVSGRRLAYFALKAGL
jgi:hypothetical protein